MSLTRATAACHDQRVDVPQVAQSAVRGTAMIAISVRLNGQLADTIGTSRLQRSLPDQATVAHLLADLADQFPAASQLLERAIPVVDGRHTTPAAPLSGVSELALLMPIAGG